MPDWQTVRQQLADAGVLSASNAEPEPVGGGDISAAWRLRDDAGDVFLKTGPAGAADMFAAEAEGLRELERAGALRVPQPLEHGTAGGTAFIALEWIDLSIPDDDVQARLGRRLARLHQVVSGEFGWHRHNTIGATPQQNTQGTDWAGFWRDQRLGYQLQLAADRGYGGRLQERGLELMESLDALLGEHRPDASLLHGDLWSGNQAARAGQPVVFDPAVYYGDRETDIAMARLFGGFSRRFFDEYQRAWPLPPDHATRVGLYQLYHVLNHLNLFGSGYLGRAERMIEELLSHR